MSPIPRVAFDARLWRNTGIGRYIQNLIPRLEGIDLVVYAQPQDLAEVQAAAPGAAVRPCPARPFSIQELLFWHKELRLQPFALFHAPHINVPASGQIPLVVTIHDLIPLRLPEAINSKLGQLYFLIMSQLAADRARAIVAVSEHTRRDVLELLKAPPEKIRVIGEGADPRFAVPQPADARQALRDRFELDGPFVLYAGQRKRYKNLEILLRAFARLRQAHPGLRLVLAGREDPSQAWLPALIRELELGEAVVETGYLSDEADLVGLYQEAAVLAFPSRYEGFGLPPVEAMAAGVPVVASDAASIPEVVGDAAILVGPDDLEGWVAALERALGDGETRARLVEAGRRRVAALSWERSAQETLALYRHVLGL